MQKRSSCVLARACVYKEQHSKVRKRVQQVLYANSHATQYRWPRDAQEASHKVLVAVAKLRHLTENISSISRIKHLYPAPFMFA